MKEEYCYAKVPPEAPGEEPVSSDMAYHAPTARDRESGSVEHVFMRDLVLSSSLREEVADFEDGRESCTASTVTPSRTARTGGDRRLVDLSENSLMCRAHHRPAITTSRSVSPGEPREIPGGEMWDGWARQRPESTGTASSNARRLNSRHPEEPTCAASPTRSSGTPNACAFSSSRQQRRQANFPEYAPVTEATSARRGGRLSIGAPSLRSGRSTALFVACPCQVRALRGRGAVGGLGAPKVTCRVIRYPGAIPAATSSTPRISC